MDQLLVLFIAIPMLGFFATLLWQNKSEKAIGRIVRFAKVFNIAISVSFAAWWMLKGFEPVSYKLATLYETEHFVFAIHLFYDEVTAVFSIVGSLLFFLVATFSKYYMHRDQGYKRFFNTILLFATAYNFIILAGNFETLGFACFRRFGRSRLSETRRRRGNEALLFPPFAFSLFAF